jgi:hypothetical protein
VADLKILALPLLRHLLVLQPYRQHYKQQRQAVPMSMLLLEQQPV